MNTIKVKCCSSCGIAFDCGDVSPEKKCWCNDFPPIFNFSEAGDCLCPNCFKNCCSIKIDEYVATLSPETALDSKAKDLPKTTHLMEGIDYIFRKWKLCF